MNPMLEYISVPATNCYCLILTSIPECYLSCELGSVTLLVLDLGDLVNCDPTPTVVNFALSLLLLCI